MPWFGLKHGGWPADGKSRAIRMNPTFPDVLVVGAGSETAPRIHAPATQQGESPRQTPRLYIVTQRRSKLTAIMASVTSLDKDMRKLRMDRYTDQAVNEVRTFIEESLGERLREPDLIAALKDGVALCKYEISTAPS
jgi:hypothetical protein